MCCCVIADIEICCCVLWLQQFQQCGDYAIVKPVKTEGQAFVGLVADQDIKVWKLCHSIQNSLIVVYSWGAQSFLFS
jgi:hypothetical protein